VIEECFFVSSDLVFIKSSVTLCLLKDLLRESFRMFWIKTRFENLHS